MPSPAPDLAPPYLTTIILWLASVALIDVAICRGRIGGFRNLFIERAERIAWAVWDRNTADKPGEEAG